LRRGRAFGATDVGTATEQIGRNPDGDGPSAMGMGPRPICLQRSGAAFPTGRHSGYAPAAADLQLGNLRLGLIENAARLRQIQPADSASLMAPDRGIDDLALQFDVLACIFDALLQRSDLHVGAATSPKSVTITSS